jgi:hypothetical protein
MIAGLLDIHALLKMLYSSLAAGVGVAVVFSVAVLGVIRAADMRRSDRALAAAAYAALAAAGLLLAVGAVIYGLVLVAHKS